MKRQLPAYIYDKGGVLYFQRRGWPSARIASAPHTPEFAAEYARILAGARPAYTGRKTFAALVKLYVASPAYGSLSVRTARDYDKVLAWITEKLGELPVAGLKRKDVIRARDANASAQRFANYIVQVLRIVLNHAHDLGWVETNAAKGVSLLKSTGPEREAWPPALIEKFREAASGRTLLIFELCLGTGQRIGDVLRMRWSDIDGDGIEVKQGKTGTPLWIPLTPRLRATLDATPRVGLTICAWGKNGKPTSYRGAADLVMAVRETVGAKDFDLHGLRYSAAAELAALGCTDEQIASITGHKSLRMVAKYAGAVRQRARATEAQGKRK
ncbi:site-specific integrase [Frigidibacter sp. MR17.24]|uniref:site-specific integrase n=1 Tax=Frigidibacter sp. MR17.24 TaxID=3127345 RepID=UPI003012BF0C